MKVYQALNDDGTITYYKHESVLMKRNDFDILYGKKIYKDTESTNVPMWRYASPAGRIGTIFASNTIIGTFDVDEIGEYCDH